MEFKDKVKKRLEKLEGAKELQDEGIVSLNSTQQRHLEKEIDILKSLLEGEK